MALTKTTTKRNRTTDLGFTKPEIEAAWLLVQLSGDSDDYDDHLSSLQSDGNNRNDDLHVLIKDLDTTKKGKKKKDREKGEQRQQSSGRSRSRTNYNYSDEATSSAMSGTTVSKFVKRNRNDGDEDEEEEIACGMKQRIKKYRSIEELYSMTKPLQIKLLA